MAKQFDDTNHAVRFKSSLGGDLVVRSMTGEEEMGRLFTFHIELQSPNTELHFDKIVGEAVTVVVDLSEGERYFHGHITDFRYMGRTRRHARYQATVRPWFWFLTRTSDCRIFQNKTVPEIIKAVFKDNGMANFSDRLRGSYRKFVYCVQYRESDFNFISRLMEQEGVYYFFEHEVSKHTLVLVDDNSTHKPFPKFEKVPYFPPSGDMMVQTKDHLQFWAVTQSITPDRYAISDFNFEKSKVDLLSKFSVTSKHAYPLGDPEIFDYPGEYLEPDEGTNYVEIRLQELKSQHERVQAGGPCRGMSPGCVFTLEDYPRADQNKEYLVISVSHHINGTDYVSGSDSGEELYQCQIEVVDKKIPFRAERLTPKPMVRGPQTAIVVGEAGEEISTDKYGRVKVQFHWDRYGKKDENSSCWIRVSQLWAGKNWGAMHIPRIGQEVIVSFMEGDPDQPIITGRVYNDQSMPPYTLDQNKTQSGIKSRSTKDGGPDNFNEIRFEDKIGEEEVYIHAEKDQNNVVENDETTEVGHDRTENVGNNETISIGVDRTEDVGKNESITIGANRSESVAKNETISIGENRTEEVGKNETISIAENRTEDVGKNENISIGANQTISIAKNQTEEIGDTRTVQIAKDDALDVGKTLTVVAGDQIVLKTGSASIVMKKDGSITIKGKDVKLVGSGKIDLKASKAITMKGSKINQN